MPPERLQLCKSDASVGERKDAKRKRGSLRPRQTNRASYIARKALPEGFNTRDTRMRCSGALAGSCWMLVAGCWLKNRNSSFINRN